MRKEFSRRDSEQNMSSPQGSCTKLPRANTFEDLIVWQKARALTKRVYEVSRQKMFSRDFGLAGQSQRATVSVMENIAEGFDRRGSDEFAHFLSYAKGSCSELRSNLYVALDSGYLTFEQFSELRSVADEIRWLIQSLIESLP